MMEDTASYQLYIAFYHPPSFLFKINPWFYQESNLAHIFQENLASATFANNLN